MASTRYRVLNLLPLLEENGIETDWITLSQMSSAGMRKFNMALFALKVLKSSLEYDVIYIQKTLLPRNYLRLLVELCNAVVYDFDDAIYSPYSWEESNNEERTEKLRRTLRTVSAVTTGSPVLSEFASQYSNNVYSLPTSIPRQPYEEHQRKDDGSTAADNGSIIIGWIGNPSNLRYLKTIEDPLEKILNQYQKVQLMIITGGKKPVTPLIGRGDVSYREWSLENELELLSQADIGIRPLVDDEWTRGKGGFTSVVQSMALGLPVVVTPVAMLSDIVNHGGSGFHARNNQEWIKYIGQLIENQHLREKMGERATKTVGEQRFWADQRAADLEAVLREAVSENKDNSTDVVGWKR